MAAHVPPQPRARHQQKHPTFPVRSPNLNLHPVTRPQPHPAPAPTTPPHAPPATPTERLAAIIAWLAGCVAEQGCRQRLAGPLVVAIWTRLRRISAQFLALAATPVPPARPAPAGHNAAPDTAPRPSRKPRARRAASRSCPVARAGCCA